MSSRLFAPTLEAADRDSLKNPCEIAPGIARDTCWIWGWIFTGSADALLRAGLLQPGAMPEALVGSKKFTGITQDGRPYEARRTRGGKLAVRVRFTEHDREARRNLAELAEARGYEARELERLSPSRDVYRKGTGSIARQFLEMLRGQLVGSDSGYAYSPDAIDEFEEKAHEILELLQSAPIRFSEPVRAAAVARIKAKTAKADKGFVAFLGPVLANTTMEADLG